MSPTSPPVAVFAFANDDDAHLALLKQESSQINEMISPLHDNGALQMYREESATIDEIAGIFQRFDRRIMLFHYGGHAGGHGLRLEEGDAQAGGLASYFQQQKDNLQLVFLNGCSTLPQVDRLMALGVKAVIATSTPIEDTKAVEFAKEFYRGLSVRQPIKRAFESASAMLQTRYAGIQAPAIINYRGIRLRGRKDEALPWGLYVNEKHKDILDWRLPFAPRNIRLAAQEDNYNPNQYLKYLLEAMLFLNEDLRDELINDDGLLVDTNGNPLNDQQKFYIILKHLPWPVGAQFQKLIAMRALNLERLRQIASTYVVTGQTILCLIVSQLIEQMDEKETRNDTLLQAVFDMDRHAFSTFDFLGHARKLFEHGYLQDEKPLLITEIIPFLRELEDEKSDLYRSYLELEELRDSIQEKRMNLDQAVDFYESAEAALAILLSRVAFLVKYKLLAVRDIQVVNYRHAQTKYLHRLGELNGVGDMLGLSPRELSRFTHCDSILLVHHIDDLEDDQQQGKMVNLTPLMIDENAFLKYSTDVLNIYLYAFREGDIYYYYKVNNNIFNVLDNPDNFLAISTRMEKDEDDLYRRFLPVEQSAFLSGKETSEIVMEPVWGRKNDNPYTCVVEQIKMIKTKISGTNTPQPS